MIARLALLGLQTVTLAARGVLAARVAVSRRREPPSADGPLSVLMLSQYPSRYAGTKYRLRLWADGLRRSGHHVDVVPAVPSPAGERLTGDWSVRGRASFHLRLLATRVPATLRAHRYDVVVLHMNDLPFWEYGSPFVAKALRRLAGRVLVDFDDLPVVGGESDVRARSRELVRAVDGLILGNETLATHFPDALSWRVPTSVYPSEWPVPDRAAHSGAPLLGWVGSVGNARYLEELGPVLADVCRRRGARLRVIGGRPPSLPDVPVEFVPWSAAREIDDLLDIDIGLAPLSDGPMERCKCGLKALQYMATGAPVVASPVGALREIVRDGETGLHATTSADWTTALERLIDDREARLRMGAAARASVERAWSVEAHLARYERALRGVRDEVN